MVRFYIVSRHDDDVTWVIDLSACSRDANTFGGRVINGRECTSDKQEALTGAFHLHVN